MKLGHHLTQKNDSHFFEEDLPLVFGTNKMGSKFTRLHSNCVWNRKSFFRFLIRKYLHPKIDQSDSMKVISSLLHTKTNIELIPFYCKVILILS